MDVALIGSVSSSHVALEALLRAEVGVTAVLGLDESRSTHVCDYRSLRELATGRNIPFAPFVKVSDPHVKPFLRAHQPDLLWVIGLSQLLPEDLIGIAHHGGVGFHPTLLPRGRGRAPVAWTILLGERAAVSLFFLTGEPDAGDVIAQREVPVLPDDYSEDLIQRTNEVLGETIVALGPRIKDGTLPRRAQDQAKATYYEKRTLADGLIDWSLSTDRVYRLVRAAGRPYHGAFTFAGSSRILVWRARPASPEDVTEDDAGAAPGTIVRIDPIHGTLVRTIDGGLWLTETVVEGDAGRAIDRGVAPLEVGTKLGGSGS